MIDLLLAVVLGLSIGILLGLGFFASLWWTTRTVTRSERPGLVLLAGMTGRLLFAGGVLAVVASTLPSALIGCLLGFVVVRTIFTQRVITASHGDRSSVRAG